MGERLRKMNDQASLLDKRLSQHAEEGGVLTPVDPSSVARHEVVLIGGKMSLGRAGQTHTARE